ncbi:YncE family protein [Altererythrobacter arenosus]|uniref:YncE family protein n=1 Tax=Altererythrobacter arenosus TaxID=3032592 RepID=A0ABY8FP57_9SPHN|nr:YncE family protein [Altererythrobacter sp. CAU 1644]WFL76800.1 YncE family protein [Altererythrobacter sp. CAU 1644]
MIRLLAPVGAFSLLACSPAAIGEDDAPAAEAPQLEGQYLFVANKRGNSLSKIDLASGEEVKRVDSCANPHELAVSPDGQHVALACYGETSVEIFATADLSRVNRLDLGPDARPHGIHWGGALVATAEGRQSIFVIESPLRATSQMREYKTGKRGSHMVAVAPDNETAWTVDMGSGTVTRLDLQTFGPARSVEIGTEPEGIDLSPDGETLWVSARGSDKAFKLDPETLEVQGEIPTGRFPLRLAIRPQGDVAVTSNLADGSLTVIDLATAGAIRTIAVSSPEQAEARIQVTILWSDDGERIYAAETQSDTVAEIDYVSGKVLRRLKTGEGGDGMAILE